VGTALTDEQLGHAYASQDVKQYYQEISHVNELKIQEAVSDLTPLLKQLQGEPAIVDVGCGYGHFLKAMSDSSPEARLAGHELPGESAAACRELGFQVHTCALEDVPDRFDVAVLLDVAEHVPDPDRFFSACAQALKKNGHIYIHTPRRCFWDTLSLALVKLPAIRRLAVIWLFPRVSVFHLQLWTDRALELALDHAGFQVIGLKAKLGLSWPMERYTRVFLKEKFRFPSPLVSIATSIANLLFIRLGALRNKAVCLARKRNGA
jgi:2-polyprenyl-3-methyl-5-hydroxy-6-metoxy-1,4-benzoquinol methylase